MNKVFYYAFCAFYIIAGSYHFVNPEFYYGLIPDYLPYPKVLNFLSGTLELLFGILALFTKSKKLASYGIMILLLLFVPSHIYFIQVGCCVENSLCVSPWIAWVRLTFIHPVFMYWAWWVSKTAYF